MKIKYFSVFLFLLLSVSSVYAIMITSTKVAYVNIEKVYSEIAEVKELRVGLSRLIEKKKNEIEELERAIASVRNKLATDIPVEPVPENINMTSPKIDANGIAAEDIPAGKEPENPQPEEKDIIVEEESEAVDKTIKEEQPAADVKKPEILQDLPVTSHAAQKKDEIGARELGKILDEREAELKKLMNDSKNLIINKEKEFKYRILGKIFDMIKEVADENSYTVILDKEMILFSDVSVTDVTDEVIKRLNKKYDPIKYF